MATEVGSLVIPIEANTAALDKAAQTIASFGKKFDTTVKKLVKSIGTFGKSIDTISKNMKGMSTATVSAAKQSEQALAKQAAKTVLLRAETQQLVKTLKATGEAQQFPAMLALIARRLNVLKTMMAAGKSETVEYAEKSAKLTAAMKDLSRATKQVTDKGKKQAQELMQEEKAANQADVAVKKLAKGVQTLKEKEEEAAKKTFDLKEQMINLSKSVSVALGPLNGVAARITSITSLANRNTIAIAAMIGGVIALGTMFAKSTKVGIQFEKQMNIIENQLRSTGRGATVTANEMRQFAQKLATDTLESAETVRGALIILGAEAGLNMEQLKSAATSAADLAASGLGSIDIAARRMLRAFADPSSGLEGFKRAGISFTVVQKRIIESLIETGQKSKAFDIILKKLHTRLGGAAVASAKGLAGALDTLTENMTLFFEVQSQEGGVLDAIADSINRINTTLAAYNDNTAIAIASGSTFAAVASTIIDVLGVFVTNIDLVVSAFAGFLGIKIFKGLLNLVRSLNKVRKGALATGTAIGFITKAVIGLLRFAGPIFIFGGLILAIGSAFLSADEDAQKLLKTQKDIIALQKRLKDGGEIQAGDAEVIKDLNKLLQEQAEKVAKIKEEVNELSSAVKFIDLRKALQATNNVDVHGLEELRRQFNMLSEAAQQLAGSVDLLKGGQGGLSVRQKVLAQELAIYRGMFIAAQEIKDAQKGITDEVDLTHILSVAQKKIILDQNKEWHTTADLVGRVNQFLKDNNQLTFEMSERMSDAAVSAKTFLQKIEDASKARSKESGLDLIDEDQIKATNKLITTMRTLGLAFLPLIKNADEAQAVLTKLYATVAKTDAVKNAAKSFHDFEIQQRKNIDAEIRLAEATLLGGEAVRIAIINNKVLAGEYKHRADAIDGLRNKLMNLAVAQDAASTQRKSAGILRGMDEQVAVLKTQLMFLGQTELQQNQINVTIEKTLDLMKRGEDLSGRQAKLEFQRVLIIEKLGREYQLVLDRQADLKSAIEGIGDAIGDSIGDAIVDFENLRDVISSLEKDILRFITSVLITDPIKRGISTGLAGFTDPTGPKGENVSAGVGLESLTFDFLDKVFGKGIKDTESITGEDQADIIAKTSEALLGLTAQTDVAAAAVQASGTISQTTGTIVSSVLGVNAASAGGSLALTGTITQTLTGAMIELIGATKLASAALAAMAAQGAGSGAAGVASQVLGIGLGAIGIGSPATPFANVASVTDNLMGSFHGGADFKIAGKGGVDRNLIQFMASRGERVTVTPTGGSKGGTIKQTLIFNVSGETSETTMNQIAVTVGRHTQRVMNKGLA